MSEAEIQEHQHSSNEEERREKRGRIRRFFAWATGFLLMLCVAYVFVMPIFADASHINDISGVVNNALWGLIVTFLGLAGVDSAVDAVSNIASKRK